MLSLNFIWYYPKSSGTYMCLETFNQNDIGAYLINLNRLISYYFLIMNKKIIKYEVTLLNREF